LSKIEVNAIEPQCGTNLTVGASGDTITFPSGTTVVNNGSQTGFGRTGTVDWDTTAKTASFTAVSGNGYFVNTTSGAITLTLPASPSAGDIVAFKDYASTFATNNLTIGRNGSNLDANAGDKAIDTNHTSMSLVYVDGTQGWKSIEEGTGFIGEAFITATGGTITECGNCKIHTFTGPGTFTVSTLACTAANNEVSYMVIAGGGGGGSVRGGGGGAGGFRETKSPVTPYTASPLDGQPSAPNRITVAAQDYPIAIGSGGNGGTSCGNGCNPTCGTSGGVSTFSTITAAGGGYGGSGKPSGCAANGGSGGGGLNHPGTGTTPGGSGNTPPVTPPQGNPGGTGTAAPKYGAGGGGGATVAGQGGNTSGDGGNGGAGATTSITGSPVARAGGGGGAAYCVPAGFMGCGADGGGPAGGPGESGGVAGTVNTGGGGGGGFHGAAPSPSTVEGGGNGGSGIVVIRYKFQ
jgi:hypothetical protein